MATDRYGKEAYKIVLDLESDLENLSAKVSSVTNALTQLQNVIGDMSASDFESIQEDLAWLNSSVAQILEDQQTFDTTLSGLRDRIGEVELQIVGISSSLDQYVPKTRTINNKPLSQDITLTYSDVGLETMTSGDVNNYFD